MSSLIQRKQAAKEDITITELLSALAEEFDATILTDKDGDFAILRRYYERDGRQIVRHAPDRCDYHSTQAWIEADAVKRRNWVC